MEVSVITPVHPASYPYLAAAAGSLFSQTRRPDEWVIVCNGGTSPKDIPSVVSPELNVQCVLAETGDVGRIGALKARGCKEAAGDVFVELDADDLLAPAALQAIEDAFERHPEAAMVYSDVVPFTEGPKGERNGIRGMIAPGLGFDEYAAIYRDPEPGKLFTAIRSPRVTAHSVSSVLYAPDHVRAWRRVPYGEVGGHNPKLAIGDDVDLTQRIYLRYGARGIVHIPEPLYLYRRHDGQKTAEKNDRRGIYATDALGEIVEALYDQRAESLALRWASDEGLLAIDLGGGLSPRPGYLTVDRAGAAIEADLEARWPFADGAVGVLRASHVFEHLADKLHVGRELYRVLAPGGWAFIEVPSALGAGAFQDPTHTSYWVEESFAYWADRDYARFLPEDSRVRFQVRRMDTRSLSLGGTLEGRMVPVIRADLVVIKDGFQPPGPIHI